MIQTTNESPEVVEAEGEHVGQENNCWRLRPGATVLHLSADRLQVVLSNHTVTFKGMQVVTGVERLLTLLTEAKSSEELTNQAASGSSISSEFYNYLLELLRVNECLVSGSNPADFNSPNGHTKPSSLFHASLGRDCDTWYSRMASKKVLLAYPTADDSARKQLESLKLELTCLPIDTKSSASKALSDIEANCDDVELLAVWGFPYRLPFLRLLNEKAVSRKLPLLAASCEGVVGKVGPYVIPNASPCIECLNKRVLANSSPDEWIAFVECTNSIGDAIPDPPPAHSVFQNAVASFFALEVERIAGRMAPTTIGAFWEMNYFDASSARRSILKVPGCDSCSTRKPERLAWNATYPALHGGEG